MRISQGQSHAEAVDYAVTTCISEDVLADFLRQNRAEVVDLFLFEWDEEKYLDLVRRESREEVLIDNVHNLMDSLDIDETKALDLLKIPDADRERIIEML